MKERPHFRLHICPPHTIESHNPRILWYMTQVRPAPLEERRLTLNYADSSDAISVTTSLAATLGR